MFSKAYKDIKRFIKQHCMKKQKVEPKDFDKNPGNGKEIEKSTEKTISQSDITN